MKYLAAYTLLTLGGKKDISNSWSTQKPQTSSLSSETSAPKLPTRTSIESSAVSREKNSTNSSPVDLKRSEAVLLPPSLPVPPRKKKTLLKSNKRRKRSPRSRPLLLPRKKNKMKIWEDSSTDPIAYLTQHSHLSLPITQHYNHIKNIQTPLNCPSLQLFFLK